MDIYIIQEECTACGACFSICSDVFKPNDEGRSEVISGSDDELPCVMEAIFACPAGAIHMDD